MRHKFVLWFLLVFVGFLVGFQTAAGTAGTVCIDKTIRIVSVQPTVVAASRHSHNHVSEGSAKKLVKIP
jgi:hypothetical protein